MRMYDELENQPVMTDTPAHRAVNHYIGVSKLHRNILEYNFSKTGVFRSQHQILVIISNNPRASQKEIAGWLNVSTATIAVSVKKLEKGGYIRRIVDEKDNRCNSLCLTEMGREMVEHSKQFFHHVEEQMFCDFTPEDFILIEALLKRIYNNLSLLCPEKKMTEREDL